MSIYVQLKCTVVETSSMEYVLVHKRLVAAIGAQGEHIPY